MSPIGSVESFQRLQEFPSFISCIKYYGRPIIPPLLTENYRDELQQIREAAVSKEAEIRRRKEHMKKNLDSQLSSNIHSSSDFGPFLLQETCALWYPSSTDHQEGVSIAISKFPTSSIYSSVHSGAIVCSDLVENSHRYAAGGEKDSSYNPESVSNEYLECPHSSYNLDCRLCQTEYDQNFHNCSFGFEVHSEVPCRTYSLLQSSPNLVRDDQNSTVEETDCESLLTVISIQKPTAPGDNDDTESSVTCLTQSTDLEKYMDVSCEFSSPNNSEAVWDSKSSSQHFAMSRSDDASSGTMVNTENELTPCASTLAEFTDNIDDEFSIADEASKDFNPRKLKRAHSVDSYMKIIQSCARSMHVKKSSSEPLNTDSKMSPSSADNFKAFSSFKTSLLIKEDSKESDESKDLPERDVCVNGIDESFSSHGEDDPVSNTDDINLHQKKRVRKNSYTLDHPSSALILAHADCSCSFDSNSVSPHSTAIEDKNMSFNSAFTKEKVEITIPVSVQEKYPILNSNGSTENPSKENLTAFVVDVFPVVSENNCEKSNSENSNVVEDKVESQNMSAAESNCALKLDEHEESNEQLSNASICDSNPSKENVKHICKELEEQYQNRVRALLAAEWSKFEEEIKEKFLQEKISVPYPSGPVSNPENPTLNKVEIIPGSTFLEAADTPLVSNDNVVVTAANPFYCSAAEQKQVDNSTENQNLKVPFQNSSPYSSPPRTYNSPENSRALPTPSSDCKSPLNHPSKSTEITNNTLRNENSITSSVLTFESNEDPRSYASNSLYNMDQFPPKIAVLIPQYVRQSLSGPVSSDMHLESPCSCDESSQKCYCYESFNGYNERGPYHSDSEYAERNFMLCQAKPQESFSSTSVNKYFNSVDFAVSNDSAYSNIHSNPEYAERHFISSYQAKPLDSSSVNKDFNSANFPVSTDSAFSNIVYNPEFTEGNFISYQAKQNESSSSNFVNKDFNSADLHVSNHSAWLRRIKTADTPSKLIKDSNFSRKTKSLSSPDIRQLPNSAIDKSVKSVLQQSSKDKTKFPVDNIISLCKKTLKSGSVSSLDVTSNKKLVIDPDVLKRFEKLPAFVKGYLTRRLFKTERVKGLKKTLHDTALLISKLSEDLSMKGDAVSERDVDFHRQLIVQLMTTFHSVYDIFCSISRKEQLNIISESRNFRLKQKAMEQMQDTVVPVTTHASVPDASKKQKLSSATLKALERKKRSSTDSRTYTVEDIKSFRTRSAIENRTYTIEDLKGHIGRPRSQTLSKSQSVSSSIYKPSIGVSPKRKTVSCKTSTARRCVHLNWVP